MPHPLIATDDPVLVDELLRLAAAAGVEPRLSSGLPALRGGWLDASVVLLGDDVAQRLDGERALPRRDRVVIVGSDLDDAMVWQRAVSVGAGHVVFLPDCREWLVELLADASGEPSEAGQVVGVVGGSGGAGATTFATALALAGVRDDREVLLVDADPLGGGIDMALGEEHQPGARWPDLREPLPARADLRAGLPRIHGLTVVSASRSGPLLLDPEVVTSVLRAGRRGSELVVVDLPRSVDLPTQAALGEVDVLLVVTTPDPRAVVATMRVAERGLEQVRDIRLVVRVPPRSALDGEAVAELLGLPLAVQMRPDRSLAADLDRGEPPGLRRRSPLATAALDVVRVLPPLLRVQRSVA